MGRNRFIARLNSSGMLLQTCDQLDDTIQPGEPIFAADVDRRGKADHLLGCQVYHQAATERFIEEISAGT